MIFSEYLEGGFKKLIALPDILDTALGTHQKHWGQY